MMLRARSTSGDVVKTVPLYKICLSNEEVGHPTLVRTEDRPLARSSQLTNRKSLFRNFVIIGDFCI